MNPETAKKENSMHEHNREDTIQDLKRLARMEMERADVKEYSVYEQKTQEPAVRVVVPGDPQVYPRLVLNEKDLIREKRAQDLEAAARVTLRLSDPEIEEALFWSFYDEMSGWE